MVRARSRLDAYELIDMGVKDIYRESLDTSVRLGIDVLIKLGFRKYSATRAGQNFIKYDEVALRQLARHRHDQDTYIFNTREQIQLQEQLLTNDREVNPTLNDHAWDSDLFTDKFADQGSEHKAGPVE
jgi:CPA2 family monovalent cation:H+ antiporter-2